MPATKLTQFLTLPKLELLDFKSISHSKKVVFECRTTSTSDFCPHCGLETSRVHDTRTVNILDAPHGNRLKKLVIKKKRWRCLGCKKVFTESIPGISKGARVKDITGDKRKLRVRKLLLLNGKKLDYWTKSELHKWLEDHPKLQQLYYAKETLHKLYRCKGMKWARRVLIKLLDTLALSQFKELQRLRRTLMDWKEEILNYFENRITNGRTEGFNNVCKQLQKRAYGYRSFKNYRLKVLYACS